MQPIERFMKKVQKQPNGCWIWTGANNYQYGNFKYKNETYAHRSSFVLHKHEIPIGMFVLHKCDVPLCVNPEHLFVGNHKDNMQDKINKNRQNVNDTKKINFVVPMNTTDIIQFLGGTFAVAKMCKVSPPAVSQWRTNGIPKDKLVMVAGELEKKSDGKFSRKEIENWKQIWPELR
jgi:DNA-binding transcriptional regulator YdaS (Cro superfamily)